MLLDPGFLYFHDSTVPFIKWCDTRLGIHDKCGISFQADKNYPNICGGPWHITGVCTQDLTPSTAQIWNNFVDLILASGILVTYKVMKMLGTLKMCCINSHGGNSFQHACHFLFFQQSGSNRYISVRSSQCSPPPNRG